MGTLVKPPPGDIWGVWEANLSEAVKGMAALGEIVATFWMAQIEKGMSPEAATQTACALVAAILVRQQPGATDAPH